MEEWQNNWSIKLVVMQVIALRGINGEGDEIEEERMIFN